MAKMIIWCHVHRSKRCSFHLSLLNQVRMRHFAVQEVHPKHVRHLYCDSFYILGEICGKQMNEPTFDLSCRNVSGAPRRVFDFLVVVFQLKGFSKPIT
jgi:hypothetical protein